MLIYSVTVTGILNNTIIGPAIPDILDHFHQPDNRAGILVAAAAVPGIVVAPMIGLLADRFGRKRVLIPCLVIYAVAGGLGGLAPSFALLVFLRFVQGIGSAGLVNLAVVIIGDHWTGNERAKLIGRNAATLTVSLAVFPMLGGILTQLGGWRLSFAPYPLALLTAVAIWRMLPEIELHPQPRVRSQLGDALRVLRQPLLLGATGAAFLVFFLIFGLYLAVLPVHLEDEFGINALGRGLVLALPAISSTATALSLGRLRARHGGRSLVLVGSALFAAAFLVIGVAPTLPVLLAGSFAYGFGEGLTIPTYQDYVVGAAPVASRGAVLAVWVGAARAGQVFGPLAAAGGISTIGTGPTFVVGALIAAAMLVSQVWLPAGRVPRAVVAQPRVP